MRTTIKIPVVYTGLTGRSKATRAVVSSVDHIIEIPELHENDAPLAFRSVLHDSLFNFVDYRLHDGSLYRRPCRLKTDGPHQVINSLRSIQQKIWDGMSEHVKAIPGSTIPARSRFIPMPKGETYDGLALMLAVETADVPPAMSADAEIAEWRRRADDVARASIIVSGRMYERSLDPMCGVEMDGPKRVEWVNHLHACPYADILQRYRSDEIGPRDRVQNRAYFNADQQEEAQEFLARRNQSAGNQPPALTIERWLDEYQCRDTHALELDRVARLLLNDVSWGISLRSRNRPVLLEDDTAEMVRALMHLQQAVNANEPIDGADSGLDAAMQAVIDTAVGSTRNRPVLRPHVRDLVSYAVERWQDRPIMSPRFRTVGRSM